MYNEQRITLEQEFLKHFGNGIMNVQRVLDTPELIPATTEFIKQAIQIRGRSMESN